MSLLLSLRVGGRSAGGERERERERVRLLITLASGLVHVVTVVTVINRHRDTTVNQFLFYHHYVQLTTDLRVQWLLNKYQ